MSVYLISYDAECLLIAYAHDTCQAHAMGPGALGSVDGTRAQLIGHGPADRA